jgi:branched-chain amino acid transport system substrate-binding protein
MKSYRAFVDKYMPGIDLSENNYLFGYTQGLLFEQLLKRCGEELSRANIIKQARSLKNVALPTLQPGITINTSDQVNMN